MTLQRWRPPPWVSRWGVPARQSRSKPPISRSWPMTSACFPTLVACPLRPRRLVRLNIALAIGLKAALAIGAVAGLVSLMVAVLVGDLGASLAVTLNAMRLTRVAQ